MKEKNEKITNLVKALDESGYEIISIRENERPSQERPHLTPLILRTEYTLEVRESRSKEEAVGAEHRN